MRQSPSLLDGAALLAATADELVLATVRDTHVAIASRVQAPLRAAAGLGPRGAGISDFVYGTIGLSLRAASKGIEAAASTGWGPRLESHKAGRFVVAAVNGLIGDELVADRSPLALDMTIRIGDRDIPVQPRDLAGAFVAATPDVVVFLHGLCEDETAWNLGAEAAGTTYPRALAARGWTPVLLRANTGLGLDANAATLDRLLTDLVAAWPVQVERIALIGHSQGGLVMRTAAARGSDWVARVSDLITIGTPHQGSHVAAFATAGSGALGVLPETSAFSRWILERRSAGIRDLDAGVDDTVTVPSHVRVRLVSGSLGRRDEGVVARVLGDLLVQPDSAQGRRRGRTRVGAAEVVHLGRTDHFSLLNHPALHAALEEWLA